MKRVKMIIAVWMLAALMIGGVALAEDKEINRVGQTEDRARFAGSVEIRMVDEGELAYGKPVTLRAIITGAGDGPYVLQWQMKKRGGKWKNIAGETRETLTFRVTEENAKAQWRVVVQDA
ncbi:MAG: hypothetical protein RSC90_08950 [Clostridia bacterium]